MQQSLLHLWHYSLGPLMNPFEWQREAQSVIESADIDGVRLALIAHLEARFGARSGYSQSPTGNINLLTEPLLGVTATDAQRLAALKYLHELHEQCAWTRQFFEEQLQISYCGPRSLMRFVERLLRTTLSCVTIAAKAKSPELRVSASLAQRISMRSTSSRSGQIL